MILTEDEIIFERKNEIFVFSVDVSGKFLTNDAKLAIKHGWKKTIIGQKYLRFLALPLINKEFYSYKNKCINFREILHKFFKYAEFANFSNDRRYNFCLGNIWKEHNFFSKRQIIELFILEYMNYGRPIKRLNLPDELTVKYYFDNYCMYDLIDINDKKKIEEAKIFNKILGSSQTGKFVPIEKRKNKGKKRVNNTFNKFNKFTDNLIITDNVSKWNQDLINIIKK